MNPIDLGQPLGVTLALLPEIVLTGWSLIVLLVPRQPAIDTPRHTCGSVRLDRSAAG